MPFKKPDFNIDDAFSESSEDKIRLYSRSSEQAPLTEETIQEEPPGFSDTASSPGDSVILSVSPSSTPQHLGSKALLNPSLQALKQRAEDSTSQDSTSLLPTNPGYYSGQEPSSAWWWSHPKIRQNWKVVSGAAVLVVLGAALVLTGIVSYSHPHLAGVQGFIFILAGLICLLPGAYHLIYVYLAVKGKRGFDFHHLPLMN